MKQTATFDLVRRPAWALLLLVLALCLPARPAAATPRPTRRLPVSGQLASGANHSLLLRSNGTLYAWGANAQGQLGTGTTVDSPVPVAVGQGAVPAGVRLTQVSAGFQFSLALGSNGLVYAWGTNNAGQLGDGSTTARSSPVAVSLPAGVRFVQVAAGLEFSLALAADGTAYAWGANDYGQLGNNSTTQSTTPVAVDQGAMPPGTKLTQVAAGPYHSLALAADGTAYAWGYNYYGELGNNSTADSSTPVAVDQGAMPAGTRLVQVAAGNIHSLALAADGTAYAWGANDYGQLGNNSTTQSTTPVAVDQGTMPPGTLLVQVVAGTYHSLTLAADGTAYAWGANDYGNLGDNSTTQSTTPVAVAPGAMPPGTKLTQVAAGSDNNLALAADGTAYAWGFNGNGELGNNSTANSLAPVVPQLPDQATGYQQAAGGGFHSLGLRTDGTAYAWGYNGQGQLGNNSTTTQSTTPVAVTQGAMPPGTRLVQVAAGGSHSLALAADGTAYVWGSNYYGELGTGNTTKSLVPVAVAQGALPTGTRLGQVAAGGSHSLALAADGTAYAWGANDYGQLGNNSTTQSSTPVAIAQGAMPPGTRLVQVAAGGYHSLALAADGTAYAWGNVLGNNSATNSSQPVAVIMPAGVRFVQVAAGGSHSLALAADGTAYAWGYNSYFQLGNNSANFQSNIPVAVTMPAGVRFVQVAAGSYHSLALAADGTLYAWGANGAGQQGTGKTNVQTRVPVAEASGTVAWTGPAAGSSANHSLVLGQEAAVYSAGSNNFGQLGDGTTTNSPLFLRNFAPLPVQLAQFTAQPVGPAAVRLAWTTASELNSAYFAIERSLDGTTWAELGRVAAAGSSASPRHYAYPDAAALAGVLYYRLRQVDQDGTAIYSPVQTVTLGAGGLALYPNPASGGVATLSGATPGAAVRVLDALGRVVATATVAADGSARLGGLVPGLYVVQAGGTSLHLAVE